MTKLRDNDFRYIEKLLYDQKTHDTCIAELQAQLDELITSPSCSIVVMGDGGTPELTQTERNVARRMDSIRGRDLQEELARRKRHQRAVTEAMKYLDEAECQLVFLRYYEGKTHGHCARKLSMWDNKEHVPLSTYWRLRRRVLEKVARFLGLM